jgi:SHS2 domain-containing protein
VEEQPLDSIYVFPVVNTYCILSQLSIILEMMEALNSGFQEIEHTADTAIRVWASELPGLFEEAARGMYYLTGTLLLNKIRKSLTIVLQAQELEGLLVMFLEELLFISESENLGFDHYNIEIKDGFLLTARLEGTKIREKRKEIKAVTFHNMVISRTNLGYEVIIVFDV